MCASSMRAISIGTSPFDAVAPSGIRAGIAELLERKRATSELGLGPPIPELGRFIETELERHRGSFSGQDRPELVDEEKMRRRLNEIFRSAM